ncbi:hypothetical protein BpHYR1_010265 [Brachionus plicatilis]|uniref:Uncharacterized protein n=1 Tax=Brachionus plicatilis TaxID=10195 RepID=A0A3M7SN62_BRAPC|nr:hypothetical protein BpHYR1_010265 [Brachionus plicatilis]
MKKTRIIKPLNVSSQCVSPCPVHLFLNSLFLSLQSFPILIHIDEPLCIGQSNFVIQCSQDL